MIFVSKANLPNNSAVVLIGENYSELVQESLECLGVRVLPVPANPDIDARLSSHVDLSVFHAGGKHLYLAKHLRDTRLESDLVEQGFELLYPDAILGECYPDDCKFNVCSGGNFAVYNENTAAGEITDFLKQQRINMISCKQGYSKCAVLVVDENSIISADRGISLACREKGIDVLEICQGFIDLAGFDYGFIGGAGFKLSKDTMAFTGHLNEHPDRTRILSFLESRDIRPVFLTEKRIFDVGSILPIIEKQR